MKHQYQSRAQYKINKKPALNQDLNLTPSTIGRAADMQFLSPKHFSQFSKQSAAIAPKPRFESETQTKLKRKKPGDYQILHNCSDPTRDWDRTQDLTIGNSTPYH